MKKRHDKDRRTVLTISVKRSPFGGKTGGQDTGKCPVPDNIKKMLESDDPKERMVGVYALGGNRFLLKEVLENCPSSAGVAETVARQLGSCPDVLVGVVPMLWTRAVCDEPGAKHTYKAAVEVLASMADEIEDFRAHAHIPLVSKNALARSISVKKLAEEGHHTILHEIYKSSNFDDTRKQAKELWEQAKQSQE